ncbi:MAG: SDR family NAD(P)-dependent oxidoreductase [Paracoccaceae bacterium]
MDRALVIGASGGIGSALAKTLQQRGSQVTALSRRTDGLDLTDERSIRDALDRVEGPFDLVIVATGALEIAPHGPEKTIKTLDPAALAAQFALNATGPALVLKHALQHLPRDRRVVFAALGARVGSIGDNRLGGWYSYRAAKAALNQLIHTAAIEVARSHRHSVVVTLHPGTVATGLSSGYPDHASVSADVAVDNMLNVIRRLTPTDSGYCFDWAGSRIEW